LSHIYIYGSFFRVTRPQEQDTADVIAPPVRASVTVPSPARASSPFNGADVHNGQYSDSGDRYGQLKSRRDDLIIRVYEMKRQIDLLQAEMDSLRP
jgi:hypothetical protein